MPCRLCWNVSASVAHQKPQLCPETGTVTSLQSTVFTCVHWSIQITWRQWGGAGWGMAHWSYSRIGWRTGGVPRSVHQTPGACMNRRPAPRQGRLSIVWELKSAQMGVQKGTLTRKRIQNWGYLRHRYWLNLKGEITISFKKLTFWVTKYRKITYFINFH